MRRASEVPSRSVLIAGLLLVATTAGAEEVRVLPEIGSSAWHPVPLRKVEHATRYEADPAVGALRATSRCSASLLVLEQDDIDLARTPWLGWRWRADRLPASLDERTRSGDDFAARVYVAFRLEPSQASLAERARHRIAELYYGHEVPGSALVYVWTRAIPPGNRWVSPYTSSSWMIAQATGTGTQTGAEAGMERGDALRESWVDVRADYRATFGKNPPPVRGISIMTDSDNTCSAARAWYAGFRFAAHPGTLAPAQSGSGLTR